MRSSCSELVLAVFLSLLAVSCKSQSKNYCQELLAKVKEPAVTIYLENWIRDNVAGNTVRQSHVQRRGLIMPGYYGYQVNFEWAVLGFDERRSQIKLINPHPKNVVDGQVKNISSIFFAERSRFGIIVKLEGSEDFGLGSDKKYLIPVSDRVGVLCIDGER